jgi:hypothetical protein
MDKALDYLGIARKAGLLQTGPENCGPRSAPARQSFCCWPQTPPKTPARGGGLRVRTENAAGRAALRQGDAVRPDGTAGCTMLAFTDMGWPAASPPPWPERSRTLLRWPRR